MAYKAALFDLDDTLLCSSKMKWKQHQTVAMREYGVTITDEDMQRVWGKPFLRMIEESYQGADDPRRIAEVLTACNEEFPKTAFEGSAMAINLLIDTGVPVGVISSAHTEAVHYDLRRLGFNLDAMAFAFGEDSVGFHKPDARVFDKPLQIAGTMPADTVYVGDLFVDFHAANSAGLDFIAVTTGIVEAHEFEAIGAKTVTTGIVQAVDRILVKQ